MQTLELFSGEWKLEHPLDASKENRLDDPDQASRTALGPLPVDVDEDDLGRQAREQESVAGERAQTGNGSLEGWPGTPRTPLDSRNNSGPIRSALRSCSADDRTLDVVKVTAATACVTC